VEEVFLYRKSRGKYGPNADGATTATLSIRINVLGFPGSAMFSHDAFSDQSTIIFHALVVAPPSMVYIYEHLLLQPLPPRVVFSPTSPFLQQ
jgi:hypothetical protein